MLKFHGESKADDCIAQRDFLNDSGFVWCVYECECHKNPVSYSATHIKKLLNCKDSEYGRPTNTNKKKPKSMKNTKRLWTEFFVSKNCRCFSFSVCKTFPCVAANHDAVSVQLIFGRRKKTSMNKKKNNNTKTRTTTQKQKQRDLDFGTPLSNQSPRKNTSIECSA